MREKNIGYSPLLLFWHFWGHLKLMGSDERAAFTSGVKINWVRIVAHLISGVFAALSAICFTALVGSGDPIQGTKYTLLGVTALILGGASLVGGLDVAGILRTIGIDNPFGRKQETEADYLGLIFSSLAGYDIRESVKIWERMQESYKGKEPPEWMSTHPSSDKRIESLRKWIPEIILNYPPIKKIG